jgi:hypothetical protein
VHETPWPIENEETMRIKSRVSMIVKETESGLDFVEQIGEIGVSFAAD